MQKALTTADGPGAQTIPRRAPGRAFTWAGQSARLAVGPRRTPGGTCDGPFHSNSGRGRMELPAPGSLFMGVNDEL